MGKMLIDKKYNKLFLELKTRVTAARYRAAVKVNNELIILYHYIGNIILQSQEKEGWGAKIIDQLSRDLRNEFPEMRGFSTRNLKYMRKFAKAYPDIEFVQQVAAQLPWYHNITLLDKVSAKQARLFYVKHAIEQRINFDESCDD